MTSENSSLKAACMIPTYNGGDGFLHLLDSLNSQTARFDIFAVDSGSSDGTLETAQQRGIAISTIPKHEFNHGGTRQRLIEEHPGYDLYIFLTQDVILASPSAIERLIAPFKDPFVGAVCGQQLPHANASLLAQHARLFNYPDKLVVKTISDVPTLGLKTPFMSNSFAAYRAQALTEAGGFPSNVILSEDMYVAAKMLVAGWKIVYTHEAKCYHSHNYTIIQEGKRYFDIGVFHARAPWIRERFGGAGGEGFRYVKSELQFLGAKRLQLWPSSILRNTIKLIAYKLGQKEKYFSKPKKLRLGMNSTYWENSTK